MAVLELERQVAVLELGENFKQLSDLVYETKVLFGLVDDQIVNTKKAFSAEVKVTSLAVAEFGVELQKRGRDFGELASFVDALGRLHDNLKVKVLHVDQQVMSLVEWSNDITTNLNDIEARQS